MKRRKIKKINQKRYPRGKLALKILVGIAGGLAITASLAAPNTARILLPALRKLADRIDGKSYAIKKSLNALKQKRLILVKRKGDDDIFVLTERGRQRILQANIETITIADKMPWDKKWHVILFDIPEVKKNARDAFRLKLQELGFYQLQKSCFVHPFACKDEIDFVAEFFQVAPHICYFTADFLDQDDNPKSYFEL